MPYNNYMQGGMFGPLGGSQNIGGMGQLTDRDLQLIASQMGSPRADRGRAILPNYGSPAPAGGPQGPPTVPGIGSTGIDPSMMAGAAEGGLQGINMNPTGDSMGGMQDAIMDFGARKLEEERLRKLLATAGGGANTLPPGLFGNPVASGGGGFTSVRGGTGPTGMGWVPTAR